jgi:hypothetical protein
MSCRNAGPGKGYPYLKMYGAVTDASTANITALIQQTTALGGQVEASASFSLNEEWTGGYWIDGKKIYRKVINCGEGPAANTYKNIPLNLDIAECCSIKAVVKHGTVAQWIHIAELSVWVNNHSTRTLDLRSTTNLTGFNPIMATLEYTKTTDQVKI